ncbi:hypothetical protein Hypma_003834 [Hypsizygus marmoreus]|uniref:Uncharacterized protein n=1 Tax=Hypsizygus marmoreus TaxID=39966 RepID=A0A369K9D5_HYPMA|nr:hypothetical protein Hypma_003834 [Hypsizygus marmoreus]
MVAHNPLFHGRWTAKKFNATVINDIWPEVFFFTLVATMVSLVSKLTPHKLIISNQLLTVLGTVLGLVISFRTSSAYERYQDGRKMWTNITIASRNLAQMVWVHVPNQKGSDGATKDIKTLQGVIEKKTMINLIQAFSVSVKHFLRGEPGVYYQDLYPLICFLPRYANIREAHTEEDLLPLWHAANEYEDAHAHHRHSTNVRSAADELVGHRPQRTTSLPEHSREKTVVDEKTVVADNKSETSWFRSLTKSNGAGRRSRRETFDPERVLPDVSSERPLKPARNPPATSLYDYIPLLRFFKWIGRTIVGRAKDPLKVEARRKRKNLDAVESNVPLEICLVLSSYTAHLMQRGLLQPALATGVTNNITMLQDTFSNLDRIRNTPLPFAYQAHLRLSLWLYLLFLPFQIYAAFGYYTIPGTAFASFLLLGFLEIGQEIENPFNYDLNDLDLDAFCLAIQRELHEITAYTNPDPSAYVFNAWNQPFAPYDRRSAADLIKDGSGKYTSPHEHIVAEPGMASIRRTLVNSWREVDKTTRQH